MGGRRKMLSPLFTWRSAIASAASPLTPTERLVALVLSLHMSERGDSCYPNMETVAGESGLGLSTVRASTARLDELGWLERTISPGRGRSNTYRAVIPADFEENRQELAGSGRRSLRSLVSPHGSRAGAQASSTNSENRQESAGLVKTENRQLANVKPPADASKTASSRPPGRQEDAKEGATAAGPVEELQSVAQVQENDLDPAAAVAEQQLVAEIEALPGFDAQSWQALTKVTQHLGLDDVAEALETLRQRSRVTNPMGLLTTLLRVRRDERRREQAEQVEAELERRAIRSSAEKIAENLDEPYIRSLPLEERVDFLEGELDAYARRGEPVSAKEAAQLRAIAKEDRRESPRAELERWIRGLTPRFDPEHVRRELDAFCDEHGLDHIERGELQELAEEARERAPLKAVDEAAA